jgi:hypothetical protein
MRSPQGSRPTLRPSPTRSNPHPCSSPTWWISRRCRPGCRPRTWWPCSTASSRPSAHRWRNWGSRKIKTIGDEYMAASGVPVPRRDHAEAFTDLALKPRDQVATKEFEGRRIRLRIGINFDPVLAGIIRDPQVRLRPLGRRREHRQPDGIGGRAGVHPDQRVNLFPDRTGFVCERRGLIHVKGKGEMDTYSLVSRRSDDGPSTPP